MMLSAHFSLEELIQTNSGTRAGLDNTPPADIEARMRAVLAPGLERVREILGGHPLHINSGYRSPAVNALVKGVPTSAHVLGYAADFICPALGTPLQICHALAGAAANRIAGWSMDQLIEEGTWVHISFDPRMRGDVLTKAPAGVPRGVQYIRGLRPL